MNYKKQIIGKLFGIATLLILVVTTVICSVPVFLIGILKLFPHQPWRVFCTKQIDKIAMIWIAFNNFYLDTFNPTTVEVTGLSELQPKSWYLIVANHQSWLDIIVLQRLFNRKIPVLKFFIKDQLKWIPLLGFSWWAMGCPFMKRYSKEYLAKHPHKKGTDTKAAQKALKILKESPSTLMSFIEGTRYTAQKKIQQASPYEHLLKPKAGGVGTVISAMAEKINHLIDVTIVYSDPNYSVWDFLCHRVIAIKIHVRQLPIPAQFLTPVLQENETILKEFRTWLNQQWLEKDKLIHSMKK